jgi:hypothetical protein
MYAAVPRITPNAVTAGLVTVASAPEARSLDGSSALASPKSSTLTVPSGRSLMFASLVRSFQRLGNLLRDGQRLARRQRTGGNPFCECHALDEFQDQHGRRAGILDSVDRRDERMVQRGQDLCFAAEPGRPIAIVRDVVRKHLERDVASERRIAGTIDLSHSSGAE